MSRTFQRAPSTTQPALRLICFPYAGGGSACFYAWRRLAPVEVDVVPVSLPGHDGRLKEPPFTDLRAAVRFVCDDLTDLLDRPFALLGHSMGAWLALELARELRRRHGPLPNLLIASASRAPHSPTAEQRLHELPDDELVSAMVERYDGIPAPLRANPELLRLLLPALRADLQMMETYAHVAEPPLDVDILALGGADDRAVPASQLVEWRRHTTRDFSLRLFPGRHFFLFESRLDSNGASRRSGQVETTPALRLALSHLQRYYAVEPARSKPSLP